MVNQKRFHRPRADLSADERRVIEMPRKPLPAVADGAQVQIDEQAALDMPRFDHVAGTLNLIKPPKLTMAETAWTKQIMSEIEEWASMLRLLPVESCSLEYDVPFWAHTAKYPRAGRQLGLPRLDALIRHKDCVSIVEAKLNCSPNSLAGAVGQLLYYRAAVEHHMRTEVDALVLATTWWPPELVDVISSNALPVRLLKVAEDHYMAALPPPDSGGEDVKEA